jgi:hypothetical protein
MLGMDPFEILQIVRFAVVVGFFAFAGGMIYLSRYRDWAQSVFVAAMLIGLLVPAVSGIVFAPFANWYFFTSPAEPTTTGYQVFVVDENGDELRYSPEAAAPGRVRTQGERIVTKYGPTTDCQTAAFLLRQAKEHRAEIQDELSPLEYIRYRGILGRIPYRSPNDVSWTQGELRGYSEFRGIRVHTVNVTTSADGTDIINTNRTLSFEYWPNATDTSMGCANA